MKVVIAGGGSVGRFIAEQVRAVRDVLRHHTVGEGGFEPPTSCTQSRSATRLRYSP